MTRCPRILAFTCMLSFMVLPAQSADKASVQPGRVDSAKELIKDSKSFQLNAKEFELNMRASERKAKKLQSAAERLELELKQGSGRLGGAKLKNAINQHSLDVSRFANHAKQYSTHLKQFRKQIGECDESEAAFQNNLTKYSIHCDQYHIPDVPPPHVCPRMVTSEGDMAAARAQMLNDRQRLVAAEADLRKTEDRLNQAVKDGAKAQIKVLQRADKDSELQQLTGEFARLKEEYETLQIQKAAIDGTKGKTVTQTAVGGKVKSKPE